MSTPWVESCGTQQFYFQRADYRVSLWESIVATVGSEPVARFREVIEPRC